MSTVRLLIDCGNTAVKIAVARGSVLTAFQRLPAQRDSLDAALRAGDDASEALLLPGAEATTRAVRAWWAQAGRGRPLIALGDELPLPDLGQYASCGRDRIAAGLAAAARHGASMIVIDAGTATTLTAWRWSASDSTADPRQAVRFAGGLILPGADACCEGLARLCPALPRVEPLGPQAQAAQQSTASAIAAAVGIGYGPMVAACLHRLRLETGIQGLIGTGGAMPTLADGAVIPRLAVRPLLVLEGLVMLRELQAK